MFHLEGALGYLRMLVYFMILCVSILQKVSLHWLKRQTFVRSWFISLCQSFGCVAKYIDVVGLVEIDHFAETTFVA
jgi:hypothetical protein